MGTVAILPVKPFHEAKQRLSEALPPGGRRALAEAMFSDSLRALRRTPELKRVIVVTADGIAQQIAGGHGAIVLEDSGAGHSQAAELAVAHARTLGAERVLLVPGDCPLLDPGELGRLLSLELVAPFVAIVPDRHGTGTNALLLCPPDAIGPSFGPGSCERHRQLAAAAGVHAEVVSLPSLALDVDEPDDLGALAERLEATRGGAAHTRGMLRQLTRTRS